MSSVSRRLLSGWVLYDDSCGFCRRWIPLWRRSLRCRGFGIAPLQDAWVRERLGLSDSELLRDIRLLFQDGSQLAGAAAYRYVMRRIGWAYPLFLASNLPLARQLFDWAYRAFARNRFRFSRACGLAVQLDLRPSSGYRTCRVSQEVMYRPVNGTGIG